MGRTTVWRTGRGADALAVLFMLATEAQVAGSIDCRKSIRPPTDTQSRAVACNLDGLVRGAPAARPVKSGNRRALQVSTVLWGSQACMCAMGDAVAHFFAAQPQSPGNTRSARRSPYRMTRASPGGTAVAPAYSRPPSSKAPTVCTPASVADTATSCSSAS